MASRRWEEINQFAQDELRNGHRAAKSFETTAARPWDRAQFLAIRDELKERWKPRNGIERTLIDVMAQAHHTFLFWMETLALRATLDSATDNRATKVDLICNSPRVTDSQAIDQAASMADRFNRIFI